MLIMLAACTRMTESPNQGLQISDSTTSTARQNKNESLEQLLTAKFLFYTLSLDTPTFLL